MVLRYSSVVHKVKTSRDTLYDLDSITFRELPWVPREKNVHRSDDHVSPWVACDPPGGCRRMERFEDTCYYSWEVSV